MFFITTLALVIEHFFFVLFTLLFSSVVLTYVMRGYDYTLVEVPRLGTVGKSAGEQHSRPTQSSELLNAVAMCTD